MPSGNIDIILENQSLKSEFKTLKLDLSQVFQEDSDDLARENRILRDLLDWAHKYRTYGNRQLMEIDGYDSPPIGFGVDLENDWFMFERWMAGKPVRKSLIDRITPFFTPPPPESLSDDELLVELDRLIECLKDIHMTVDWQYDIPPRLMYMHLLETLDEKFEIMAEGFWHLDGCTGYCPGCLQRPWCEFGCKSCWQEDKDAGTMYLIDAVKAYVSPSPVSLSILKACQAEEDKIYEEFKNKQDNDELRIEKPPFDFDVDDDLPF